MCPSKVEGGDEVASTDDMRWVNEIESTPISAIPRDIRYPGVVLRVQSSKTGRAALHPSHPQDCELLWLGIGGGTDSDMVDCEDVGI